MVVFVLQKFGTSRKALNADVSVALVAGDVRNGEVGAAINTFGVDYVGNGRPVRWLNGFVWLS